MTNLNSVVHTQKTDKEMIEGKKIILGSKSPRRRELMQGADLEFTVDSKSLFDEHFPPAMDHIQVPEFIAKGKSEHFHRQLEDDEILITADTMVLVDGKIIGKPKDDMEAARMLETLSGKTHIVATGVCIRDNRKQISFTDTTEVKFEKLSASEIEYYVSKFHPTDKAGAYGIQEWIGHIGISAINGSYFNVMGLPIHRIYQELRNW